MQIKLVKKELFINYIAHFGEHTYNLDVFEGPLCRETLCTFQIVGQP